MPGYMLFVPVFYETEKELIWEFHYSYMYKVNNREVKEVDHFKYLGSVLTRDGCYSSEIKMRTALPKKHLTEKCHS